VLATIGGNRYLTSRHVIVCLVGLVTVPGLNGIFADLPDGVYALRANQPPVPNRSLAVVGDTLETAIRRLQSAQDWRPVTATGWARLDASGADARQILAGATPLALTLRP